MPGHALHISLQSYMKNGIQHVIGLKSVSRQQNADITLLRCLAQFGHMNQPNIYTHAFPVVNMSQTCSCTSLDIFTAADDVMHPPGIRPSATAVVQPIVEYVTDMTAATRDTKASELKFGNCSIASQMSCGMKHHG